MGVGGERHAPVALPKGKKTCYALYRMLGGHQVGLDRCRNIAPTGI
jgi:hypothetical protein